MSWTKVSEITFHVQEESESHFALHILCFCILCILLHKLYMYIT